MLIHYLIYFEITFSHKKQRKLDKEINHSLFF